MSRSYRTRPESLIAAERIPRNADECAVRWPEPVGLSVWYLQYVVAHELGHHHVEKFRHKNRRWGRGRDEEAVADLFGSRVFRAFLRAVGERGRH